MGGGWLIIAQAIIGTDVGCFDLYWYLPFFIIIRQANIELVILS